MAKEVKHQCEIAVRLHTPKIRAYEEVLKSEYRTGSAEPAMRNPISRRYGHGVVFSMSDRSSRPGWMKDVCKLANDKLILPDNTFSEAIAVMKIKTRKNEQRYMSISFGHGSTLIDQATVTSDFGRVIAAQKITDSTVIAADTTKYTDTILQTSKQRMRVGEGHVDQLIDSPAEFLNRVTGLWRNGKIETRMIASGDLLKAKRQMGLDEIVNDLAVYLEAFLHPKMLAEWATRLSPVSNRAVIHQLDIKLMQQLLAGEDNYAIAWPTYRSTEELSTDLSTMSPMTNPATQVNWYIKNRLARDERYDPEKLLSRLKSAKLIAIDDHGIQDKVSLYNQGFTAEIVENSQRYLLIAGQWCQVEGRFYKHIKAKCDSVSRYEVVLPALHCSLKADGDKYGYEREDEYNKRLAESVQNGMLFDKINYNGRRDDQMRGPEEVADVVTANRELLFVKKGSSSAALSHLFAQARVSAQLLARGSDVEYRQFINQRIGAEVFTDEVSNDQITLIFVVLANHESMPFFSMINFANELDLLREMGYKVKIAWPGVEKFPTNVENAV